MKINVLVEIIIFLFLLASCNPKNLDNANTLYLALRYDIGSVDKGDDEIKIFRKYKYRTLQITYNQDSVQIKEHNDILFIRNGNLWKVKMFNTFYKHPKLTDSSYFNYFYFLPIEMSDNIKINVDSIFTNELIFELTDEELEKNDLLKHISFYHVSKILSVQEDIISVEQNNYGWYGGASTYNFSYLYSYCPDTTKNYSLLDENYFDSAGFDIINSGKIIPSAESGVGIIRQRGKWVARLRYHYWVHSPYFKDFSLKNPLNESVVYNPDLLIPWDKIKNQYPKVNDVVFSPDSSLLIMLTTKELSIHRLENMEVIETIKNIALNKDESIVGISWK